jgi:hypothetical protein
LAERFVPSAPISCAARSDEAAASYGRALELCQNAVERRFMQRRLASWSHMPEPPWRTLLPSWARIPRPPEGCISRYSAIVGMHCARRCGQQEATRDIWNATERNTTRTEEPMATTTQGDSRSVFKDLLSLLTGQLVLPENASYEQVRQLWNGEIHTRPAAIVRCANAQDVVHTVRWARSHGRALSVRGGGHDVAGRALCEDGIVIDLSQMPAVSIYPAARTAHAAGGATAGDLIYAAQRDGLATTTGTVSTVGLTGLALGGGYGPLSGKYGLVADNLLSAQVVTAGGDLVTASATEHPDLLWGLRGGGGNFGVVVSAEYRLHPLTTVLSGLLLYPLDQASAVLHYYDEFITTAPDELTIQPGFIQLPGDPPVLFLSPTYCGPLVEGERVLAPLRTFGTPLADQIQPIAYAALITTLDAYFPKGGATSSRRSRWTTCVTRRLRSSSRACGPYLPRSPPSRSITFMAPPVAWPRPRPPSLRAGII